MTLPDSLYHFLRGLVLLGGGAAMVFILLLVFVHWLERRKSEKAARDSFLLAEYDDGVKIYLSGFSGGGSAEGAWGSISLMRTTADGSSTFRRFGAEGPWMASGISSDGPRR